MVASCPPMPRPRAHAPNKQGGKPAGQNTSSYMHRSESWRWPLHISQILDLFLMACQLKLAIDKKDEVQRDQLAIGASFNI